MINNSAVVIYIYRNPGIDCVKCKKVHILTATFAQKSSLNKELTYLAMSIPFSTYTPPAFTTSPPYCIL